jgi:GNAT superfamily N-acetyltransferase
MTPADADLAGIEWEVLGWPPDGPTLRLDHERFSYAGKFVMSTTGKALASDESGVVAAIAFNADRTDDATLWLRYVTVRADRRGAGIGPCLTRFVVEAARQRGYERVAVAVNNPFAYEAMYRAGFGYTGVETGLAELRLEWPSDRHPDRYQAGLDVYRDRDLSADEREFLEDRVDASPPAVVSSP